LIHGTLDVAIQSDLPGMIRATTSDNVWSFDGRRILIPKGSRLIGEYKSGLVRGQSRVFVVWTRMLDAESKTSVQLGSIGTDDLGRAGLTGDIDKHYVERFGSAVLLSIIGGGAQFIAGLGQNQNSTTTTSTQTFDPATGRYTTVQTQPNQNQQNARQIGAQQISQTLTTLAQDALKDSINIPPTIHVDQGTRIEIFVKRDLDFSALFPDPVRVEAMRLRRGGAPRYDVDPTPAPIYAEPVPMEPPVYLSPPRAIVRKP
jgi:type IV secretion system protein VirB10